MIFFFFFLKGFKENYHDPQTPTHFVFGQEGNLKLGI